MIEEENGKKEMMDSYSLIGNVLIHAGNGGKRIDQEKHGKNKKERN